MTKIVSDVVVPEFALSASASEAVSAAAEMAMDSQFDFRKACDSVAGVFGEIHSAGLLTFAAWEVVRKRFESVASVRARDNGAANPDGAANDCWLRVAGFIKEYHGLTKPKSENPESAAKQAKREAEKAKAIAAAGGKSAAELKADIKAAFGEATDESIARAKALEKSLKAVESAEKEAVSAQMKPLIGAANDAHKALMDFMKEKNDPVMLGDYVVLLKKSLDAWKSLQS